MQKDIVVQFIKSTSDIGSAVAHLLKKEGYCPVLLEGPSPGAIRRLMSFAGAVHAGEAELEGLRAVRCDSLQAVMDSMERPDEIPLMVMELDAPLPLMASVLVDARMRKKKTPPVQIDQAPLVVGIGPGFQAGNQAHVVIESNWGEALGSVITQGGTQAYTGEHRVVGGFGAQRYLYSPKAGSFTTDLEIGAKVEAGQAVAVVSGQPMTAEISGLLRGLAYSGLRVEKDAKVVEIDPTGNLENISGIKERPAKIARGVLRAIREHGNP